MACRGVLLVALWFAGILTVSTEVHPKHATSLAPHWYHCWVEPTDQEWRAEYRRRMFKDYGDLLGGPERTVPYKAHVMYDFDEDGDIDLADFAALQRVWFPGDGI